MSHTVGEKVVFCLCVLALRQTDSLSRVDHTSHPVDAGIDFNPCKPEQDIVGMENGWKDAYPQLNSRVNIVILCVCLCYVCVCMFPLSKSRQGLSTFSEP